MLHLSITPLTLVLCFSFLVLVVSEQSDRQTFIFFVPFDVVH